MGSTHRGATDHTTNGQLHINPYDGTRFHVHCTAPKFHMLGTRKYVFGMPLFKRNEYMFRMFHSQTLAGGFLEAVRY